MRPIRRNRKVGDRQEDELRYRVNMPSLFKRCPRRYRQHLFGDLPFEAQRGGDAPVLASCQEWGRDLPSRRRAILIGQARRWVMTAREGQSQWGRSMLTKRGGFAVQQQYREQGRIGRPPYKAVKKSYGAQGRQGQGRTKKTPQQILIQKARHRLLPIWRAQNGPMLQSFGLP